MNELNTATKLLPQGEQSQQIFPKNCPVCGVETNYIYRMEDGKLHELSDWYRCQCGVLFQSEVPAHDTYDEAYVTKYAEAKKADQRYDYYTRVYAPLIEDLIYGRTMLEVGFCAPYILKSFEERGWLTWGIDVNPTLTGKGNLYQGDFATYDFAIQAPKLEEFVGEAKIERNFDLIWMGHVLEHFNDPLAVLNKAYNLLDTKGLLFIATPDIDFINKTGLAGWGHFKKKEHYIMWSEVALRRELERLGFKIVMMRRNFSSRFISWYDLHCIAQKNYF